MKVKQHSSKNIPTTTFIEERQMFEKDKFKKVEKIFSTEKNGETFLHWQLQCVTKVKQKPFKLLTASFPSQQHLKFQRILH